MVGGGCVRVGIGGELVVLVGVVVFVVVVAGGGGSRW